MIPLQLLGLYLSTNSSVSAGPKSCFGAKVLGASGSILGIFRSTFGLLLGVSDEVDGSSFMNFFSIFGLFFSSLVDFGGEDFLFLIFFQLFR
jgi:hypothetical protein